MEHKLKPKERLFCMYYCQSRDPRKAAAKAGYSVLRGRAAAKLLGRTDIQAELERLDTNLTVTDGEIISGYRTLAFGSAADAIRLLTEDADVSAAQLEEMDLMNISEIKRPKGGGLEIKFFDRLKALERLQTLAAQAEDKGLAPFYSAIENSAAASAEDADAQ